VTRRQGQISIEAGAEVSRAELQAGRAFAGHGYDVTHLRTASSKGVSDVRTPDLSVGGIGPVDVLTPRALNSTSIARAIEGKAGQAPTVLIRADIPARQMHITARRVWGKPGAQGINEIIFEHNSQLTHFRRPGS
jgi:hypothetical protein